MHENMLGEHKTQLLHAVEVITVCLPEAQLNSMCGCEHYRVAESYAV